MFSAVVISKDELANKYLVPPYSEQKHDYQVHVQVFYWIAY